MNKKFTILTAAYNSGKYIHDWADSIMAQEYRPLEVVCVEDKSNDNTLKMLIKVSKQIRDKGIEFNLIEPNKKLFCGSAYNLALKYATGEYFGILDSDDMLEPFAVKFIVDIYERFPEVAWMYTQYKKYNRLMNRVMKIGFCRHPQGDDILSRERMYINTYGHWRTFSNRIKSSKNLFGEKLKGCVDKHLGIRLEEEGDGMFVDKVCYKYRTRGKSIVHTYPLKRMRQAVIEEADKRRKKKRKKKEEYQYKILKYKELHGY